MSMRILHSSDWHVGRTVHGEDMAAAHREYFAHLLDIIIEKQIDALLVAGDVFDRAVPSLASMQLLTDTLAQLTQHTQVILTPGNHDSAVRLGFLQDYLKAPLHIAAHAHAKAIELPDRNGDIGAVVYGLPFLDPDQYRFQLAATPETPLARSHQEVTAAALEKIKTDAKRYRGKFPIIVMAHAFVTGAAASDSERNIEVGGVDNISADLFTDFDYVALGHLHRPQQIGDKPIYYSGSPIPFSFSEAADSKRTLLIETEGSSIVSISSLPAPVWRQMSRITTTIGELENGKYNSHAEAFCEVTITDNIRPDKLYARVKAVLPYTLALFHEPEQRLQVAEVGPRRGETEPNIIADFLRQAGVTEINPSQQKIITSCLEAAHKLEGAK